NLWRKGGNGAIHEFSFETSHLDISSQRESTSNFLLSCVPGGTGATQSVLGRVFALPNDVVVSVRPSGVCNQLNLLVTDPKNSANNSSYIADVLPGAAITKPVAVALADFDRDGYDDVFFIDARFAQVYTAVCNNDPFAPCTNAGGTPSQGLKLMVQLPLANELYASPPVTGDFNGDGAVDVAWPTFDAAGSIQIRFMSVCPAAVDNVLGHTCTHPFAIVQSNTHISTGGTVNFTSHNTPRPYVALVANNFDGRLNPTTGIATAELLVALANSNHTKAGLTVYRFDQNLAPQSVASLNNFPDGRSLEADENNTLQLFLASGPLDGTTGLPQAVFASTIAGGSVDHHGYLSVISFDQDLNMTAYETRLNTGPNNNNKTRIFGLAVGRFDPADIPDPDDPDTVNTDFDQHVAALVDFDSSSTHLQLFTIPTDADGDGIRDQDGYPLTLAANRRVSSTRYYDNSFAQFAALQAGDLQGRSLQLGAPSKVTVVHTQADIILGLPPMHVDVITPPRESDPRILNVTVFPKSFNTAYEFEVSSGTQSSRKHNTSYAISNKEIEEGKQVFGNPKESNVTLKTSHAETQAHQNTSSKLDESYSG